MPSFVVTLKSSPGWNATSARSASFCRVSGASASPRSAYSSFGVAMSPVSTTVRPPRASKSVSKRLPRVSCVSLPSARSIRLSQVTRDCSSSTYTLRPSADHLGRLMLRSMSAGTRSLPLATSTTASCQGV